MTDLQKLLEKYHIGQQFKETSHMGLQGKTWYFLFVMIATYLKENFYDSLEGAFIKNWMTTYWYKIQEEGKDVSLEDREFYKILCKLENGKNIIIPKIIKKFFDSNSNVGIHSYKFNCNVYLKDIEIYLKCIDLILIATGSYDMNQKYDKKFFNFYAYEEKEGIARASGNGAVLTLPKVWVGKNVIAYRKSP